MWSLFFEAVEHWTNEKGDDCFNISLEKTFRIKVKQEKPRTWKEFLKRFKSSSVKTSFLEFFR